MRWFLVGGIAGIAAVVLVYLMFNALPIQIAIALCPFVLAAMADPLSVSEQLVFGAVILGTNFVLYAFAGLAIGFCVAQVRDLASFLRRRLHTLNGRTFTASGTT